jgi:hypothetical protein
VSSNQTSCHAIARLTLPDLSSSPGLFPSMAVGMSLSMKPDLVDISHVYDFAWLASNVGGYFPWGDIK